MGDYEDQQTARAALRKLLRTTRRAQRRLVRRSASAGPSPEFFADLLRQAQILGREAEGIEERLGIVTSRP